MKQQNDKLVFYFRGRKTANIISSMFSLIGFTLIIFGIISINSNDSERNIFGMVLQE
ncbi:MAG: hypothetical protein LBU60_01155 [Clostridiales bacterium]|nr:hypothetical protein [Clostridiales bacterium]